MHINISGHHLDLTDPLKDYINEKFSRLHRHVDQITSSNVILSHDNNEYKAESNLHVAGHDVFASANSQDMYASIDKLTDKLDRQLIKHKEKVVRRKHDS